MKPRRCISLTYISVASLCAPIRALRGGCHVIGDDRRQGLTVDRLRGRVDHAHAGVALAEVLQQPAHALDVDLNGEVMVGFRAGRHDPVEDEDGAQRLRGSDKRGEEGRVADIAFHALGVLRVLDALRDDRFDDVSENKVILGLIEESSSQEWAY